MSRKPIAITREQLAAEIAKVEMKGPLASRSALYAAIAETTLSKSIRLKPPVIIARIKQWHLEAIIKTPLGQKGRKPGQGLPAGMRPGVKGPRAKKRISLELVADLKKIFPAVLHGKVDRAARGSLKAAVALKCIDCSGGDRKEVALCTVNHCPLWSFRPYQLKADKPVQVT